MTSTASGRSPVSTSGETLCKKICIVFDFQYDLTFLVEDAPEDFVTTIGIVMERKNALKTNAKMNS